MFQPAKILAELGLRRKFFPDSDGYRRIDVYIDKGPEDVEEMPLRIVERLMQKLPTHIYVDTPFGFGEVMWVDQEHVSCLYHVHDGYYIWRRAELGFARRVR